MKEQAYPKLVALFYSNLSFEDNVLYFRVGCHDMKIPIRIFARVLHLSCDGADIYDYDLEDFGHSENESPHATSRLVHNDDNSVLVKNKVKYYTLTAQVLAEISFYNILLKSGEYCSSPHLLPSESH